MFVNESRQYEIMPPVPMVTEQKKTHKEVKVENVMDE